MLCCLNGCRSWGWRLIVRVGLLALGLLICRLLLLMLLLMILLLLLEYVGLGLRLLLGLVLRPVLLIDLLPLLLRRRGGLSLKRKVLLWTPLRWGRKWVIIVGCHGCA